MPEPTRLQTTIEYLAIILAYWWALLPGLVMPLPDIYKWVHPKHKELRIPLWLRLGSVVAALFVAQFLAYRNSARNLATVIEDKRQLSVTVNAQSSKVQDANHQIEILKMQKPQPTFEPKNSLRKRRVGQP